MSCHWLRIDDAPYVIRPATVGTFDLDVTFPFLQVGSRKTFHLFTVKDGGKEGGKVERWEQRLCDEAHGGAASDEITLVMQLV